MTGDILNTNKIHNWILWSKIRHYKKIKIFLKNQLYQGKFWHTIKIRNPGTVMTGFIWIVRVLMIPRNIQNVCTNTTLISFLNWKYLWTMISWAQIQPLPMISTQLQTNPYLSMLITNTDNGKISRQTRTYVQKNLSHKKGIPGLPPR